MERKQVAGFDWNAGNFAKCQKHGLAISTIESLFSRPLAILPDESHSGTEIRYRAIAKSEDGRYVFIVFTLRQEKTYALIRPISARYMHRKEVDAYEKANPDI